MAAKAGKVQLAIHGGPKAVTVDPGDMFKWPIVTAEDEAAVLEVLRRGAMSGNDVTRLFEQEMADYFGLKYALGHSNGTASLLGAMWACGVRRGDEIIGPSLTYWASVMPALSLGATVVFADADAETFCLDPKDIERRITDRTRAIVAVHLCGHPCDMDAIMEIGRRRGVKVIEDVSHAHGALYKGRLLGTLGDVACMSLMAGKSLAIGEAGMLLTNDRLIWERALAFGFYERTRQGRWGNFVPEITDPELARWAGLPLGGVKHRLNQTCSAMGRVQLRHYPARIAEIQKAMNCFWDGLAGVPAVQRHRIDPELGTMGGWYYPHAHYRPEELGGLPVERFCAALNAEGVPAAPGIYAPLHLHPVFHEADIYGDGRPTAIAFAARDVRQGPGSLPVTEAAPARSFMIPWFKHCRPEVIRQYSDAVRKAAENAWQLRES